MASSTPLAVIINRSGGTASKLGDTLAEQLHEAFALTGATIDLQLVDGCEIARAVENAGGDTIAVGGGDGTLSCAAGILSRQGRCLAVLPLGTLNHFAQAIGLDGSLEQAARTAVEGQERCIDLGQVGDRMFINNASLGLYPRMVRDRDRLHLPKWLATIPAAARVLWRPGSYRLPLAIDGRHETIHTPLLFIGNNRYSLGAGSIGERKSLEDGVLSLYAVTPRSGPGLLLEALRIIRGKANRQEDFAALADARKVSVEQKGHHPVAMDGEVTRLDFPLTFSIRPKALKVRWPTTEADGASTSGPDPR